MQKFAQKPLLKQLKDTAKDDVTARLKGSVDLQFVYDFARTDTPFDKLTYVNNAGRSPLHHLPDNVFLHRYGLDRLLKFKIVEPRARVAQEADGFYSERGVELQSMELTSWDVVDEDTLQEVVC